MPTKKQTVKTSRKPAVRRPVSRGNEKTKMVSFGRAVSNFFKKYFKFNGTATRAEYWWVILFLAVIGVVLIRLSFVLQPVNLLLAGLCAFCWLMFGIIVFVPLWALQARRLHDVGVTAKILFVSFAFFVYSVLVPYVLSPNKIIEWVSLVWGLIVFALFLLPSKKENNPYRE